MRQKRQKRIRSTVPIYASAAVWMLYCLLGPLYKPLHFVILAALTAAVYITFSKLFPGKLIMVKEAEPPKKDEPESTGDPELDSVIAEGRTAMKEMGRLYSSIQDAHVRTRIVEIMEISQKIIDDARHDKSDIPQIKKFLNYYLPTTIKLLNAYDRMSVQGIDGENISGTMTRVEDMLDTVVVSYKKQLDSLFADEAMDIETDIKVMDTMLRREGLKDREF